MIQKPPPSPPHNKTLRSKSRIFCAFGAIGYNNHVYDNIDHGYIRTDYLDIDIHDIVYNNTSATTLVNNVRVVTRVHATPVVTVGGKRGETVHMQLMMTEKRNDECASFQRQSQSSAYLPL